MHIDFIEIKNYGIKKPFTSFLPGIAGLFGRPLWTFYTNRGQLMMSFGFRDKNGAIQEFFPANAGYMYERVNGFKTFIKIDNKYYSFFNEPNDNQVMRIYKDRVEIEETNDELKLTVNITYFTIPNESVSALARIVKIINNGEPREIEVLDGLTQILPCGIDYGGYKAVSNLLQSWMDVDFEEGFAFFKLRGSTADSTMVSEVTDGNFFISKINNNPAPMMVDIKRVYEHDTSFNKPHGFIKGINLQDQVTVNQVPCAYSYYNGKIDDEVIIESMFGYASNKEDIKPLVKKIDKIYFSNKLVENENVIKEVLKELKVETNYPLYDAYLQQSLLDNLLRGGKPYPFVTKNGLMSYHLYSRKHGDPERDYNFFTLEPMYFSQGNGNFRDVLQNRRNDNFFYLDVKDFNIKYFGSTIQPDGYNPLSIEGVKFKYEGNNTEYTKNLNELFTPGEAIKYLIDRGLSNEEAYFELTNILKDSVYELEVNYGEGFWQDHFTYLYDLIENYLRIYPDKEIDLLFNDQSYSFFQSPVKVRPRDEKSYLMPDGKIRQHEALAWMEGIDKWANSNGKVLKVNLASKLLTLILNKYSLLDSDNIGVMYEADRPGWNDALNGLPGVFGSGVGEMIELLRLTRYYDEVLQKYDKDKLVVINPLVKLMDDLINANGKFEQRLTAIEEYRTKLFDLELVEVETRKVKEVIKEVLKQLEKAFESAKKLPGIIPTYLTYEVTDYVDSNKTSHLEGKLIIPTKYKRSEVAPFLEAPARAMKVLNSHEEALDLYKKVKVSDIYDHKLKMYKTSSDLSHHSHDLGRIRMFTKGWLERESNFLHMNYKYLFGLIKAGLYQQYYEEIFDNYTCFMDMEVYGRSVLENSSFIATSNNPDPKNHGRGFVSRLSGSTAELMSMYTYMFFGKNPFIYDTELKMIFKPILDKSFFKDNKVTVRFYNSTINYINNTGKSLYEDEPTYIELIDNDNKITLDVNYLNEKWAKRIRKGDAIVINVYYKIHKK